VKMPFFRSVKQVRPAQKPRGSVSQFITENFRHFNARELREAAEAYKRLVDSGGKMFVTVAGAMSTGELGISLAKMIREEKVHAICCTGANLEEDIFNLVAHSKYKVIAGYRQLDNDDEKSIHDADMSRVTDTLIPDKAAMDTVSKAIFDIWKRADKEGERSFPHEYVYQLFHEKTLDFDADPEDSWVLAAHQKNLPLFVPGWEDSTLGNMLAGMRIKGEITKPIVKDGIDYMMALAKWYEAESGGKGVGFFQIGGGISGDFSICVVPLLKLDLKKTVPFWAYFCQISDSLASYGGYSGAPPNEKITWAKIDKSTPTFMIQSDASIVAPLIFAYVLEE
jgi:deoxyhypusine synthase